MNADINKMTITACFLYAFIESGVTNPILERKYTTTGNSKTTPAGTVNIVMEPTKEDRVTLGATEADIK